jgi:hypothetical protein
MSSYFKSLKYLGTELLTPAFQDLFRSLPDSLFLGTGLFALITQSFPLGILFLAMAEAGLLQRLLGGFVGAVQPNEKAPGSTMCLPGIPSPYQLSAIGALMLETAFPSGPIFFVSAVFIYIISSTLNFKDELKELGQRESEWNARIPLSMTFSLLFLVVFILWRYMNSCDDILTILGSVAFGGLAGGLIYMVHVYLFGRDSINFLGVPLLADKTATGRPLYVCSKKD